MAMASARGTPPGRRPRRCSRSHTGRERFSIRSSVQVILAAGAHGYVTDADTPWLINDVNNSVGQIVGLDQPVFDGVDVLLPGAEGAVGRCPTFSM